MGDDPNREQALLVSTKSVSMLSASDPYFSRKPSGLILMAMLFAICATSKLSARRLRKKSLSSLRKELKFYAAGDETQANGSPARNHV